MIHRFRQVNWSNERRSDHVHADRVFAEFASQVKTLVRENPQSTLVVAIAAGFVVGLLLKERK